ncbi:right-handed beta helix region protein [Rhizoctonia solani]|uniref:Right-handed beta helix region protein n=1 Tax=Rhizoctonia solani TaxID=456999 RepID=A0A8H8PCB5_9AGAM|nr:right-handed beta helix region protein [Rhizoctonia solani]QRW27212.1 right-handed beta helix region protein [Rhizoctonia solani]
MSDFFRLADKFKDKLGISHGYAQQQQGGHPGSVPYGQGSGTGHPYQGSSTPYNPHGHPPSNYGMQPPWDYSSHAPSFPAAPSPCLPQPHSNAYGTPQSWPSGPPPIPPRTAPPTVPARPEEFAPRDSESAPMSNQSQAGVIYAPGTYPTPELFGFPFGKHAILNSPEYGFTARSIQQKLDELGPNSTLYLPRGSRWEVESMISMYPFQELATEGYPTAEQDMAWLEAKEECHGHLINAFSKSGIRIRNILVEGNREKFGHDPDGKCMIILGDANTCNQVVDRCILRNPRHWSCLQAFEGSTNIRITNNFIGPAGYGADVEDGKWADGISFSASDGLVAGNQILDATDGAIVIFGAPGSLITSNTVINRHRLCLGGLNMVDYNPHKGNYKFTRVINNTVRTEGAYIKVGVGMGPSILGKANEDSIEEGGIVMRNLIESRDIGHGKGGLGYGYAVGSDTANWTCIENVSAPGVEYFGDISESLPELIASPTAFVRDGPAEARGNLQSEFVPGHIECLFRIKPGPSTVLGWSPGQLHLALGSHVKLRSTRLCLERGGEVCVREHRHHQDGRTLWTGGSHLVHQDHAAALVFAPGGKLMIVDTNTHTTLHDFTPHIRVPDQPDSEDAHSLVLSEVPNRPVVSITSPAPHANTLFMSSYIEKCGREFGTNQFIARHIGNGRGTLVYVFSPYTQILVLRTRHDGPIRTPLEWPLDQNEWIVEWSSPNEPSAEPVLDAKLAWQGDGNLVIYASGGVPWASGSHGKRATLLRWGLGTPEEPYLEIVDDDGNRVWST